MNQQQVQALWFQHLALLFQILFTIGMIAYFIKIGPASFFEEMLKRLK